MTNTKIFLVPNVGVGSWSGRMEVVHFEIHDCGLAIEALEAGFWMDDMLVECRSGEKLKMPAQNANQIRGNGFFWYDTGQEHLITASTFRNCGIRSGNYAQYDNSPTRGCSSTSKNKGCKNSSTVFGFITHSDEHNPEVMQGTREIVFEDVGRRFAFIWTSPTTISGRLQNWMDFDGSVSGLGEPTIIGSGLPDTGLWWRVDARVLHDDQGPLEFIRQNDGPNRGLAHIRLAWDDALHSKVGKTECTNNYPHRACPAVGKIRHYGPMYKSAGDNGLPVTAQPDIVGLAGGYGWLLRINKGAPRDLKITTVEVLPETPLVLKIHYPQGTSFSIVSHAAYCSDSQHYTCQRPFYSVASPALVRSSNGDAYHFSNGLLTLRVTQIPMGFTGNPSWKLWDFQEVGKWGKGFALDRFERDGLLLPKATGGAYLRVQAQCAGSGPYCSGARGTAEPSPCGQGLVQVSYDKCCQQNNPSVCTFP